MSAENFKKESYYIYRSLRGDLEAEAKRIHEQLYDSMMESIEEDANLLSGWYSQNVFTLWYNPEKYLDKKVRERYKEVLNSGGFQGESFKKYRKSISRRVKFYMLCRFLDAVGRTTVAVLLFSMLVVFAFGEKSSNDPISAYSAINNEMILFVAPVVFSVFSYIYFFRQNFQGTFIKVFFIFLLILPAPLVLLLDFFF